MDGRGSGGGAGIDQLSLPGIASPTRPPTRLTTVLFDLDGCLVDSREPILRSLNAALRSVGLSTITAVELEPLVGPPLQESVATVLTERDADLGLVAPIVAAFRDRYRTLAVELASTVPGMDQVVTEIGERYTLAVVTTKPQVFAEPILETLGLRDRLAAVVGTDLEAVEPKRETLARALQRLSVPPGSAVMVGDRRYDVAAARAHGAASIGVTWGHGTADELRGAGADHLVDGPEELPGTIEQLASPPG